MQYWWVNHEESDRPAVEGEYLCSRRRKSSRKRGARAQRGPMDHLTGMRAGDLVFSFTGGAVNAVGIVTARARALSGDFEGGSGWQVDVRFTGLTAPLRPREHLRELARVLPKKHAPIRASGARNPNVYVGAVPEDMASVLRALLGGQVEAIENQTLPSLGPEFLDEIAEERLRERLDLGPAERERLIRARRGQGEFRRNVEAIESDCRLTGLLDRRHLRARHIKPWRDSDDREKLDGFNGLLLSPHVDHLFARGHVSFSDDGELLVSRQLNPAVLKAWRIALPKKVRSFAPEQRAYLDFHRREVFESEDRRRS
jgi:putative restriction endonuclease